MEKVKEFFSKYAIYILIGIIIIVLILLILPKKSNENINQVLTLTLQGDINVSLLQGSTYEEPGYMAYDSKDGDLTGNVSVIGFINSEIPGSYTLKYYVTNSSGQYREAIRKVNIIENLSDISVKIDYYPTTVTSQKVTIMLKITGDDYKYTVNPDEKIFKEKQMIYEVSKNGDYTFFIHQKSGKIIKKIVKITNIDKQKPTGSCKGVTSNGQTIITVSANDELGIKSYSYLIDGVKHDSQLATYTAQSIVKTATVTIYDKADNFATINCTIINDDWPKMTQGSSIPATTPKYYTSGSSDGLNYLLYYPNNTDLTKKNALIVFLHGAGECGSGTSSMFKDNTTFNNNMKDGKFNIPAIYLAPQCPCGNRWAVYAGNLKSLIDKIVSKYNVDSNRISISGHSFGGEGSYKMLERYSGFFASAAILAPSVNSDGSIWYPDYTKLQNVKIAVFTGTRDGLYEKNVTLSKYLEGKGVKIKFYGLSGVNHSTQPTVFNNTNVIEWMINQSKG